MVILQIKGKSELDQFAYETTGGELLGKITSEVAEIWNLRLKLRWYVTCAKDLATRVPGGGGAPTSEESSSSSSSSSSSPSENQLSKTVREVEEFMQRMADASKLHAHFLASSATSSTSACSSSPAPPTTGSLLLPQLQEHVRLLRAAVTMHFPRDATATLEQLQKEMASLEMDEGSRLQKQQIIHVRSDDPEMADMKELLDPATCQLWFSSKQMFRDKPLSAYSGKNEKTKLLCKLTKAGSGAPAREPPLDAQAQKEMMAFWFKRQEEQKRLAVEEQEDISYGNSDWANPNALRSTFQGLKSDVKIR